MNDPTTPRVALFDRLGVWSTAALAASVLFVVAVGMTVLQMSLGMAVFTAAACFPLILCALLLLRLWICVIRRRSPAMTVFGRWFGGRAVVVGTVVFALVVMLARERLLPGIDYTANLYHSYSEHSIRMNTQTRSITGLTIRRIGEGPDTAESAAPTDPVFTLALHPRDDAAAAIIRRRILASCPPELRLTGRIDLTAVIPRTLVPIYKNKDQSFRVRFNVVLSSGDERRAIEGAGDGRFQYRVLGLISSHAFRQNQAEAFADLLFDRLVAN